ncbi:hypothetical protein [Limobrevibacterium gyesilva]|uniref:Uncharacterized protein n=1 Tax=Limobrevibacterium gyesilva TaxID=2991712 RepID=A0AA42CEQ8_9PROT|nr:hypothetical protein [Limobrevibacterium gyesilva]MCW3473851.1 hypothetical protein [Limobrevibacterium gyesilva]
MDRLRMLPAFLPVLIRDRRGFTRLEVSLLTVLLCGLAINGAATLGGGLRHTSSEIRGTPMQDDASLAIEAPGADAPARATEVRHNS